MKYVYQYYILILMVFLTLESIAQNPKLKFNLLSGADVASVGKINAIIQDKYGFMWFADQSNQCITRYDGSIMKHFYSDPNNPNSLGGYYPECLITDSSGIIWVGFGDSGIDRFDPMTNTFLHYRHDSKDPGSLASNGVWAMLIDHLGNLWVGTTQGLDRFDPETGKFKHYKSNTDDTTSLSSNIIRVLYEDHAGILWVGTGFPWNIDGDGGLNRFDRNTDTFTRYLHDPNNLQSLNGNKVRSVFEDNKGNFWIGTNGDGLHSMDRNTGLFTRHTYDPSRPEKLSRSPLNGPVDHITFITEDAMENLWIGTHYNGFNRYDAKSKRITHFGNDFDHSGAFKDNSTWWAYASKDGHLWLSTEQSNLYRIDLYHHIIPSNRDLGSVLDFHSETSSLVWFGTSNGLVFEDKKNGIRKVFKHDPLDTNSMSNNIVTSILKDTQGIFWIGTRDGLNRFDPDTGIFTRYLNDPKDNTSLSFNGVSDLYEDQELNLWIGTSGGGLDLMERNTGKFINYRNNPSDVNSLNSNDINVVLEDDRNNLWIGNYSGLNRLNHKTGRIDNYLSGLIINSLYLDSDNILWAGTLHGLHRYNYDSDNFSNVKLNTNATITSIIADDQNNLWMGSTAGIIKMNLKDENIILYGKPSGVDRLRLSKFHKLPDGKLLLGHLNGYYAFYPEKLRTLPDTTKVYITNFQLNGKSVFPGPGSPINEPIINTNEIKLEHNQNIFSIRFAAIDYRTLEDKKIYYLLENYDNDWHNTTAEFPVYYHKIPPGKYFLRIKADNSNNGLWSERSITILISPPWWNTWWAYILYGIIFIAGIILVDHIQRKRTLQKANDRAKEKELLHAREIEKAYTELQTTQNQLIQSEKMASLGELTAGIAHEIQNPLNFVNNFSEVNAELIDELKGERSKAEGERNVKLEEEILNDIKENEAKINHHGKRADAIVKGMLQHSQTSSGQKELTDINALADEYLRLAFHGLRAKDKSFNSDFSLEIDEKLPEIKVYPQDIGRVILNLINNAFYATNKKAKHPSPEASERKLSSKLEAGSIDYKPEVIVSTAKVDDSIKITVKDNGEGIPEQVRDKIFQPFFTTKPTGSGTGLGLSLSYDIIKAHGGEIQVESKDGFGSEFIIFLPLKL